MKRAAFCLMASVTSWPASAQPTPTAPVRLEPTAAWVMDYDADSCALRRTFGSGPPQVTLEMRQFTPGLGFQVTLMGKGVATLYAPLRVKFEPEPYLYQPRAIKGSF